MPSYKIELPLEVSTEGFELEHDNPRHVRCYLVYLREKLGAAVALIVRKDGKLISEKEVESDENIGAVMKDDAALPNTYRQGWGGDSDIGSTADGARRGVWKPKNPEDDFS
jgi:hypothetical protein